MTYEIYEDFFPEVKKKLDRIVKKCKKYNNDFIFNVKGEIIKEKKNLETNVLEYNKFIVVEVEGTAKIDDWECVAVMEVHDGGNIIRNINTRINIPMRFWNSKNVCEHCNTIRPRKNLFIIHNEKTDEWKQVGGSCLKLYTGGLNMELVTAWLDGLTVLEETEEHCTTFLGTHYYDVKEIISLSCELIDKIGYFNSSCPLPTKNLISWFAYKNTSDACKEINKMLETYKYNITIDYKDFHKKETEEKVNKILEYYKNQEETSEFIHNVKSLIKEEYCSIKSFGFLCYLPEGYNKYIGRKKKQEEQLSKRKSYDFFGEVGKRYSKEITEINHISNWESDWGITYIYRIVVDNKYSLIWKTSNFISLDKKYKTIDFTVKNHKQYNEENQTIVTRCKIK